MTRDDAQATHAMLMALADKKRVEHHPCSACGAQPGQDCRLLNNTRTPLRRPHAVRGRTTEAQA
jgi:hypothetical protein